MIIKITKIPDGIHDFTFEKSVDELQLEKPFINNLILNCRFDKSLHQIVANCNLNIQALLECDRCNGSFESSKQINFTILCLYGSSKDEEAEINIKYLSPTDDSIDLRKEVIEYAKLSIPMKKLCSEDCKGLCSNCGNNLNHKDCNCTNESNTSVWEPLLKLKNKLN